MIGRPPRSPPFPYPTLFRSATIAGPTAPVSSLLASPAQVAPFGTFSMPTNGYMGWGYFGQPGSGHSGIDRKSTRLNSSHANISYAVFCLKKNKKHKHHRELP